MARHTSGHVGAELGHMLGSDEDPLIGTTVGSYTLQARLGAGEAGTVYRARHRLLGHERALKLMPAPPLDDESGSVERFARELKLVASLKHSNIVPIHDAGLDDRFYFIVMDPLVGTSLDELLKVEPRLPFARSLALLAQAASALDYANTAEIPHGDLTPATIMVGPGDHLALLDFGAGRIIGAPSSLPLETVDHVIEAVAADQRALGVIAYQLLVGQPLTTDSSSEAPQPTPREIRPDLPDGIQQALLRQTSADPAQRFATSTEFVTTMRAGLDMRTARPAAATRGATVERERDRWTSLQMELRAAAHQSSQVPPPKPSRVRRRLLLATASALAACVLLTSLTWTARSEPASATAPAVRPATERSLQVSPSPVVPAGIPATPVPASQHQQLGARSVPPS